MADSDTTTKRMSTADDTSDSPPEPRQYNSPLRRQRAGETRSRILDAGVALVRSFPSWDWRELTFRAVAERAGVSERTVYRHFPTEQELSSAVMRRLEEEAGVDYEGLRLAQLAKVTARVFEARSSFAVLPTRHSSPFAEENDRRRQALLAAVADLAAGWSDSEVETVAASLDVIWSEGAYRRLTGDWGLTTADATQAVSWIIDLIVDAVESGRRPRKRRR